MQWGYWYFYTQNNSVKPEAYNLEVYNSVPMLGFFENQSKFTSLYSITDTQVCCASAMKKCIAM